MACPYSNKPLHACSEFSSSEELQEVMSFPSLVELGVVFCARSPKHISPSK